MNKPFRIAILRALHLGDMLCIIPTVRAVRHAYPNAHITLIGLPWQQNFVERFHHYFDDFVEFPGWPGLPEQQYSPARIISFLKFMRGAQFDLLLQMQGNGMETNCLAMMCGARTVSGLRRTHDYDYDNRLFPISEDNDHEVLRFLKLMDALGIARQGDALEFPILSNESNAARQMLATMDLAPGTYVCIHPGARDPRRRWPASSFATVADKLLMEGYRVLLTGSADEAEVLRDVQYHMSGEAINLVEQFGHVGIGELAYMLSQSALLFSNDTGVSHIAAALEIPSVVVFSEYSQPERWAPLNRDLHKVILPHESLDLDAIVEHLSPWLSIPVGA